LLFSNSSELDIQDDAADFQFYFCNLHFAFCNVFRRACGSYDILVTKLGLGNERLLNSLAHAVGFQMHYFNSNVTLTRPTFGA
jgi:hypothetical protein